MPKGKRKDGAMRRVPSELLRDMRLVYRQPQERDRTQGQKNCRTLLNENPKEFLAALGRLESAHRATEKAGAGVAPVAAGTPLAPDEGEQRVLELIERMLGEMEAGA